MTPQPALPRILAIDDEPAALRAIEMTIRVQRLGTVRLVSNPREALTQIEQETFDLVLLDVVMPGVDGEALLTQIASRRPHLPVVMVSGANQAELAARCLRRGAKNFLLKPFEVPRLCAVIRDALANNTPGPDPAALLAVTGSGDLVAVDPASQALLALAAQWAPGTAPLFIDGPPGSGRRALAREVHRLSQRRGRFVVPTAGGFAEAVASALGGTLWLGLPECLDGVARDELWLLASERRWQGRPADVRLLFGGHDGPESLACEAELAALLRRRHLRILPLRRRVGDIPPLVEHLLARVGDGSIRYRIEPRWMDILQAQAWPGNVRELAEVIAEGVARAVDGLVDFSTLVDQHPTETRNALRGLTHLPTLEAIQSELIAEALERADHNKTAAAKELGITRQALNSRLRTVRRRSCVAE